MREKGTTVSKEGHGAKVGRDGSQEETTTYQGKRPRPVIVRGRERHEERGREQRRTKGTTTTGSSKREGAQKGEKGRSVEQGKGAKVSGEQARSNTKDQGNEESTTGWSAGWTRPTMGRLSEMHSKEYKAGYTTPLIGSYY